MDQKCGRPQGRRQGDWTTVARAEYNKQTWRGQARARACISTGKQTGLDSYALNPAAKPHRPTVGLAEHVETVRQNILP